MNQNLDQYRLRQDPSAAEMETVHTRTACGNTHARSRLDSKAAPATSRARKEASSEVRQPHETLPHGRGSSSAALVRRTVLRDGDRRARINAPTTIASRTTLLAALLIAAIALLTPHQAAAQSLVGKIVPLALPNMTDAVFHDDLGLLITAQRGAADGDLKTYRPDDLGRLPEKPAAVANLAKPDALKAFEHYPLSMKLHPTLPLLYVWVDVAGIAAGSAELKAANESFDHLQIFTIDASGKLAPLATAGRGEEFLIGQPVGRIEVDGQGKRVFLPNLSDGIGYYDLDDKGVPKPTPVAIPGTLDGRGLNEYEMKVTPERLKTHGLFQNIPASYGFLAPKAGAVIIPAHHGVAVWDTENRRAPLGYVPLRGMPIQFHIGGDHQMPSVYGGQSGGGILFALHQADGFPSLMPMKITIPGAALAGQPKVFHTKPAHVAVGGNGVLYVVPLDDQGMFAGIVEPITINTSGNVLAYAFSRKHNRIYVPGGG